LPLDVEEARRLAGRIASGHAWIEHQLEFPELTSPDAFAVLLQRVLTAPSEERALARDPFWERRSGTIIIVNPADADAGTAFRPNDGRAYFESIP
jgi:filamentous hemagglutinin